MQVVATKPIARWQIWLGKWLGIVSLNAALLIIAGLSVYCLLQWRATKLPAEEQATLRNEILVARGFAKPPNVDEEIQTTARQVLQERLEKNVVAKADLAEVQRQIVEQVKAAYQLVPPGYQKEWAVNLGLRAKLLRDQPIQLRVKFNAAEKSPSGTFVALFQVGVPDKTKEVWRSDPMSLAPDTFHEIQIPPNLFDEKGVLTITFANPNNTALLFPLDEGMEILYREGNFGLNFARGLGIILCWMALLAAIGLASASFLSFPVAAFFSLGILTMAFSTGTLASAISEGTVIGATGESGPAGPTVVDIVAIPFFRGALEIINLAKDFSPIDSLSTGRSITWLELLKAFGQIVLLLGGIFAVFGIFVFNRRELATAQTTQ